MIAAALAAKLGLVGVLAVGAFAAWQTYRLDSEKDAHGATKLEYAEYVRDDQRQLANGLQRALEIANELQERINANAKDLADEKLQNAGLAGRVVGLVFDRDKLQNDLATYAGGQHVRDEDTISACHARAGALAALLAEGAGIVRESGELAATAARDHDDRAGEVVACVTSWPR